MTTSRHLGLDLGGTNLKVAVLEWSDYEGAVPVLLASDTVPTHAERGPDGVVAVMVEAGLDAIAVHGPIATVGIGVPGLFERETGVIRLFPNFPGPWTGYPFKDRLEAGLGRPVVFINDARAHTLAESRMGAGRGARTMALVTLGTGIGGGLIIDGKLHLGTGTGRRDRPPDRARGRTDVRLRQPRLRRGPGPGQGHHVRGRHGQRRGGLRWRGRGRRALRRGRSTRRPAPWASRSPTS